MRKLNFASSTVFPQLLFSPKQRQSCISQCPLRTEKLLQKFLWPRSSCTAHPPSTFPDIQRCAQCLAPGAAWDTVSLDSSTPEWHLLVGGICQVRMADSFHSLLHAMFYFHLFWSCQYVSQIKLQSQMVQIKYIKTDCPCEKRPYSTVKNCQL